MLSTVEANETIKNKLRGEDPMDFLTTPVQVLPKPGNCEWIVDIAIIVDSEVSNTQSTSNAWRPRSIPALHNREPPLPRAVLILRGKGDAPHHSKGPRTLVSGKALPTDASVAATLYRTITEETGLQLKEVLGPLMLVRVLDPRQSSSNDVVQIKLCFAVSVEESGVTSKAQTGGGATLRTPSLLPKVQPGSKYQDYTWVHSVAELELMRYITPLLRDQVHRAIHFRKENWNRMMDYLRVVPKALEYTDRYQYAISAVIIRRTPTNSELSNAINDLSISNVTGEENTGNASSNCTNSKINTDRGKDTSFSTAKKAAIAILLVHHSLQEARSAGDWDLPGGKVESEMATIEDALRAKIFAKTNLRIREVLGGLGEGPKPLQARRDYGAELGLVSLCYYVTVEEDNHGSAKIKLDTGYDDWAWVETAEQTKTLPMSALTRKRLTLAFEGAEKFMNGKGV